jgi:hypothetical protein
MPLPTPGLHVNPSDETIRLGPLAVHFLLTGDHSTRSVAAFELVVPAPRSGWRHRRTATTTTKRRSTASPAS